MPDLTPASAALSQAFLNVLRFLLLIEPLVLSAILYAYWFPSPVRDQWLWLITLLLPVYFARHIIHGRLWTNTPLDEILVTFTALCVISIFTAPYETRGFLLIFRPLLGVALYLYLVEQARRHGSMKHLYGVTLVFALIIGVLGIVAVDWSSRSAFLNYITPSFYIVQRLPLFEGGFNPNEIAGALCFVAPLAWGLALRVHLGRVLKRIAIASAIITTAAILVGGSQSAWIGLLLGLPVVLVPRRWWPAAAGAAVAFIVTVQILIMIAPGAPLYLLQSIVPDTGFRTLQHRELLWQSSLDILHDHPFTGVGMAMFRNPLVRADYPTPGFPTGNWHAHNELLAIGTDLGLPGILLFLALYVGTGAMLVFCWRHGDQQAVFTAMALSGGLIAHAVYGLADAIPPWDRFAFLFWSMLGLCAAQYTLVRRGRNADQGSGDTVRSI